MYKYIKAYELGYNEGIKETLINKNKKFKKIDDREILSKLYDIGFRNRNSKFIKCFDKSFNYKKNSV